MIKSMTGFGRGENEDNYRKFSVEIKSVNHRYNDFIIRMPKFLSYLEDDIKKMLKEKIKRGRVEVYINLETFGNSDISINPDINLAFEYKKALENISKELKIEDNITLEQIMKYPDILNIEESDIDEEEIWDVLSVAINSALIKLYEMRIKEGEKLLYDIKNRAEIVRELVKSIEKKSPIVVEEYKEKLKNRIKKLLEDSIEVDDTKLANEVAYFSDKSNITEELVRLDSHINQLLKTMDSNDPVGRKLDFIIQEMNREANTIGSKVGDVEITNNVVDIKSELEKIREQIQNIE